VYAPLHLIHHAVHFHDSHRSAQADVLLHCTHTSPTCYPHLSYGTTHLARTSDRPVHARDSARYTSVKSVGDPKATLYMQPCERACLKNAWLARRHRDKIHTWVNSVRCGAIESRSMPNSINTIRCRNAQCDTLRLFVPHRTALNDQISAPHYRTL